MDDWIQNCEPHGMWTIKWTSKLYKCENGNAYLHYISLYTSTYMEAVETAPFNGDSQLKL